MGKRHGLRFSLLTLLAFTAACALVAWQWPRNFSPMGHLLLLGWLALIAGQWACAAWTIADYSKRLSEYSRGQAVRHYLGFTCAALGGIAPTASWVLFRIVFGGGGSNVAQMSDDSTYDLWRLWFKVWPLLLFVNPASVFASLVTLTFYLRPRKDFPLLAMRLFGVANGSLATWVVMTFFPDA
ncbi:MAG: hypothetical protein WD278_06390 [Pirellulales bacterium]